MKKIDDNYFIKNDKVNYSNNLEDVLREDEKILYKGKPKKSSYILSNTFKNFIFVIIWLVFDITFITILFTMGPGLGFMLIPIIIFFIFHLIPVWMYIANLATMMKRYKREEYSFTNFRILIKSGLFGDNIVSLDYSSIASVNIRIGIIERLCKVGDIYLTTNDGKKYILQDVIDPYFIYSRLEKLAMDIKTDIIFPNALRKGENPGYKTSYKGNIDFSKYDNQNISSDNDLK